MYSEFDEACKLLLTFELDGVTKEQKRVLYRTLSRLMEIAASERDASTAIKIEDMRARLNALPPAKTAIQHRALQHGNEFDEVSRRLLDFELNGITKEQKEAMRRALQRIYDYAVAARDAHAGLKIQDMQLRLDTLIPKERVRQPAPPKAVAPQERPFKLLPLPELQGKIDFAIITIRDDEYEAVLDRFAPEPSYAGDRRYVISRVQLAGSDYYQVAIARSTDQGEGPAQDLARDMIEQLDPKWLLVIGIAGGIPDDDFTLGDVVVAKRLLDFSVKASSENKPPEYDVRGWAHPLVEARCAALPSIRRQLEGKWNTQELIKEPRPPIQVSEGKLYGDEAWKQKVKASLERHSAPRSPRFTTAAVAATEELVKSPTLVQLWLQDARSTRAVEMELAGVYQAAHRIGHQYPVLAIRGISDIVGFNRDPAWTTYACHTAAAFAYALVQSGFIIDRPSQSVVAPSGPSKTSCVPRWSGGPISQWDQLPDDFKTIRLAGNTQLVTLYSDLDVPVPKPLLGQDHVPFQLETGADRAAILGIDLRSVPPTARKPSLDIMPGAQGANCAYILLTASNGYRDKNGVKFEGRKIGSLVFYFDMGDPKPVRLFLGQNIREWAIKNENVVSELTDPNVEQIWHSADERFTLDMLRVDFGEPRNVLKLCVVAECEDLPSEYLDDPPHIRVSGLTYRVATSPSSASETENKQPKPLKPVAILPSSELEEALKPRKRTESQRLTYLLTEYSRRLAMVFPGKLGLFQVHDPSQINSLLTALSTNVRDYELWWISGLLHGEIRDMRKLNNEVWLIGMVERKVELMWVNKGGAEQREFVLLQCAPMPSFGFYSETSDWEDAAWFRGRYIRRSEYDDGYANIDGQVVALDESAEPRVRGTKWQFMFLTTPVHSIMQAANEDTLIKICDELMQLDRVEAGLLEPLRKLRGMG